MNDLIAKYLSGNTNVQENEQLEKWRAENPENAREFLEASEIWHQRFDQSSINVEEALANVNGRINETEDGGDITLDQQPSKITTSRTFYRYAAAAALLIFGGLAFFFADRFKDNTTVYSAANGEVMSVELVDGTMVSLDAGATLSVLEAFNETERKVTLKGKAFFEVERNEARPFIIENNRSKVTVLGTSFLVNSDNDKTEVVVNEGKVSLASQKNAPSEVILTEGESGIYTASDERVEESENTNKNYLAWIDKKIVFEKTTIGEVIAVLEDVYKVEIQVESNAILNCELTATFKDRPLESVMTIISQTFSFTVDQNGNRYILKGKGC